MAGNPYARLAGMLGGKRGPAGLTMGKILSAPGELYPDAPLRVSVGGTVQEAGDLLKNAALGEWGLAAGDAVLLLPIEDAQRYIIVCRVVGA